MKTTLTRKNLLRRTLAGLLALAMLPLFAACTSSKDAAMDGYYPNASAGNAANDYLWGIAHKLPPYGRISKITVAILKDILCFLCYYKYK